MKPFVEDRDLRLWHGHCVDVLRELPAGSFDAVVTSPPYIDKRPEYDSFHDWGALMLELARTCHGPCAINVGRIFREGEEHIWWNPILAAARDTGWKLADTLIWVKPNANPMHGNLFADSHEYVFCFETRPHCWNIDEIRTAYAPESVKRFERKWRRGTTIKGQDVEKNGRLAHEAGARPRSFVAIETGREKGNKHPAPMAIDLALHLVRLTSKEGDVILDPFFGSGTTARACRMLGRDAAGIELKFEYCEESAERLSQQTLGV